VPLAPRAATSRRALVLGTFVTASVVSIPSSWAGTIVSNVADGILTVTGTADADDVTVRCEDGDLTVNQTQPIGGPTRCGDLRRIFVFAGAGFDRVSLADVTRSAFDSLAATSISGQEGEDRLIGSEIEDDLLGGGGVDALLGGRGPDHLAPGPGGGEVIGGKGHDTVSAAGDGDWQVNDARLRLVQADDVTTLASIEVAVVKGGASANVITAGAFTGNLGLDGRGGGDLLRSGVGSDRLVGGDGNDFVQAGSGDDELEGGPGDDVLRGESGDDELRGGAGDDTCRGGPGADSVVSC
jgi:Ca2+-binding RTX toxin-like protein